MTRFSTVALLHTLAAMVLTYCIAVPLPGQDSKPGQGVPASSRALGADKDAGRDADKDTNSILPWQTYEVFSQTLRQQDELGRYPIEIEATNDDGVVRFRGTFIRRPGDRYFHCQTIFHIDSLAYEVIARSHRSDGMREINACSYSDSAGMERRCGVWVRSFPMLVRRLAASRDALERIQTIRVLQVVGKDDVEVQGVLIRFSEEAESPAVRRAAASALARLNVGRERSVTALLRVAHSDTDVNVRIAAVTALGQIPDHATLTVPFLLHELESTEGTLRFALLQALSEAIRMSPLTPLLPDLAEDVPAQVKQLMRLLKLSAPALARQPIAPRARNVPPPFRIDLVVEPPAIPAPDPLVHLRVRVVQNLGQLETAAGAAVDSVLRSLHDDPSSEVRSAAAQTLARISPFDDKVVTSLCDGLEKDKRCRVSCARALEAIGPTAFPAIERAAIVLKTTHNRKLLLALVDMLVSVGPYSDRSAALLAELYRTHDDLTVRAHAASGLSVIAADLRIAGRVPTDDCLEQVQQQLNSPDPFARAKAIRAAGGMGRPAAYLLPSLIEATQDASFSVQSAALSALSQMGTASEPAIPAMIALLGADSGRLIRPLAAATLGNLGPLADESLPALQACLTSSHPTLRANAKEAIAKIDIVSPRLAQESRLQKVRVASISFVPKKLDLAGNMQQLQRLFREAAAGGAQLAVAPEGALDGYVVNEIIAGELSAEQLREVAIPIHGEEMLSLRSLADKLDMSLAFGFAERIGSDIYNSAVFIDGAGQIRGRYHKMQFAEGYHNTWRHNRLGMSSRTFSTPFGRCAILICNDRWNPELAAIAKHDGAQLLLIPAYGSRSKRQDAAVLSRGRELGVPVVEANVGVSLIVDQGKIAAVNRNEVGITYADITIPPPKPRDQAARERTERDFLQWRRVEMDRRYRKTLEKAPASQQP